MFGETPLDFSLKFLDPACRPAGASLARRERSKVWTKNFKSDTGRCVLIVLSMNLIEHTGSMRDLSFENSGNTENLVWIQHRPFSHINILEKYHMAVRFTVMNPTDWLRLKSVSMAAD